MQGRKETLKVFHASFLVVLSPFNEVGVYYEATYGGLLNSWNIYKKAKSFPHRFSFHCHNRLGLVPVVGTNEETRANIGYYFAFISLL